MQTASDYKLILNMGSSLSINSHRKLIYFHLEILCRSQCIQHFGFINLISLAMAINRSHSPAVEKKFFTWWMTGSQKTRKPSIARAFYFPARMLTRTLSEEAHWKPGGSTSLTGMAGCTLGSPGISRTGCASIGDQFPCIKRDHYPRQWQRNAKKN